MDGHLPLNFKDRVLGMPLIINKELVIIKKIRLSSPAGFLCADLHDLAVRKPHATGSVPENTDWIVIWSGEARKCSLVNIFGMVLTSTKERYLFNKVSLEPWPVLGGSGDWHLEFANDLTSNFKVCIKLRSQFSSLVLQLFEKKGVSQIIDIYADPLKCEVVESLKLKVEYEQLNMDPCQGMAVMLNKQFVLIKVVTLSSAKDCYLEARGDKQNLDMRKRNAATENGKWRVLWSGEPRKCYLMSIYSTVLAVMDHRLQPQGYNRILCLVPWPGVAGFSYWHLESVNRMSADFKVLQLDELKTEFVIDLSYEKARLMPAKEAHADNVANARSWTIEVVKSSMLTDNNIVKQQVPRINEQQLCGEILPGLCITGPVFMSINGKQNNEYRNSGNNINYSGTQKNGDCISN